VSLRYVEARNIEMSSNIDVTETLDVKGQNCPMPVIKTKQAVDELRPGDVLEVVATDSGSMSDIKGWADSTDGVELVDQVEGDGVYTHYVRKTE
jgi:TusA-related sulfurtransferase